MENNKWCWIGVPFKRSFCTYGTYNYKEHPIKEKYTKFTSLNELNEMINIFSPTSCYFDINVQTGLFYRDQQDCVRWVYENETGCIKTTNGAYVAKSLPEFLSHIEDDSLKWFESNKQVLTQMYGVNSYEEFCNCN